MDTNTRFSRITVNLAPADQRKRGAAYDLAIAVGILVASGQIRTSGGAWALLGELSLGGAVRSVPGVLPMVATLARAGYGRSYRSTHGQSPPYRSARTAASTASLRFGAAA